MKILKAPLSEGWATQFICKEPTCKAVLEINENDLEWISLHFHIICMSCERPNIVPLGAIPAAIQERIKNRKNG